MMNHRLRRIKAIKTNTRKWKIVEKASIFKKKIRSILERIRVSSCGKFKKYKKLSTKNISEELKVVDIETAKIFSDDESDLVALKICVLGDCQIGKTSFVIKYVGDEQEKKCLQMKGLNSMDKTLAIKGAKIAFTIWDVGGDHNSYDQIPIACKDAVAILFMFDLNGRSTLNKSHWFGSKDCKAPSIHIGETSNLLRNRCKRVEEMESFNAMTQGGELVGGSISLSKAMTDCVIYWYIQARKWNKTAIPILIGTKFDDFAQLPLDIQWTVVSQARAYAKIMKATLFFSSATHNINVNKIFKFIMAKLFNLPWTLKKNLTIGEPIIDF